MNNRNPQVDAYITKAAPFARPILERLRRVFHDACPGIEEKIKWGCPSFECSGIVGGFAAFKQHATFGFWRQDLLEDPKGILGGKDPMSLKLTDESQLPPDDVLQDFIRRAVEINRAGPPPRMKKSKPKPPVKVPADLLAALKKNKKAEATFEAFSPSHRREYVEWIVESKKEETRTKRLETAVEWMAQGKSRNWKYEPSRK